MSKYFDSGFAQVTLPVSRLGRWAWSPWERRHSSLTVLCVAFSHYCHNNSTIPTYSDWEMREFFNYATPLVIMLSLYMFQFTMLFTSWCIYSDDIMTSGVALLIPLALTLETSLELFAYSPGAQVSIMNVFFPRSLIWISMGGTVRNLTWTSPRCDHI